MRTPAFFCQIYYKTSVSACNEKLKALAEQSCTNYSAKIWRKISYFPYLDQNHTHFNKQQWQMPALLGRKQRRRMPGLHLPRLKMPKQPCFNVIGVLFEEERQEERNLSAGIQKITPSFNQTSLQSSLILQIRNIKSTNEHRHNSSIIHFLGFLRYLAERRNARQPSAGNCSKGLLESMVTRDSSYGGKHIVAQILTVRHKASRPIYNSLFCAFLLLCQLGLAYSEDYDNASSKKTNTNIPRAKQHNKIHQNTQQYTIKIQLFDPSSSFSQTASYAHQFAFQLSKRKQPLTSNKPKQWKIISNHHQ